MARPRWAISCVATVAVAIAYFLAARLSLLLITQLGVAVFWPAAGVSYRHYPNLIEMARDVDVLLAIAPGGAQTRNMINAEVLAALGPNGIFVNMARGSLVDEPALIKALQDKTILSAGLDVYAREPHVPTELIAMDNVVLFPHVGSGSVATRARMDQLVVDNLIAWASGKPPLTPVAETPWPPKKRA